MAWDAGRGQNQNCTYPVTLPSYRAAFASIAYLIMVGILDCRKGLSQGSLRPPLHPPRPYQRHEQRREEAERQEDEEDEVIPRGDYQRLISVHLLPPSEKVYSHPGRKLQ